MGMRTCATWISGGQRILARLSASGEAEMLGWLRPLAVVEQDRMMLRGILVLAWLLTERRIEEKDSIVQGQ
jgi:hypothetical protein